MPSDDTQRDIDAEGQRAAIYHADKRAKPGTLPSHRGRDRLLGISPDGHPVDNVTEANRFDVDPKNPWLFIHLFSEDTTRLLAGVYIPNTRERPDAVLYLGNVFEVITTNVPVPRYRQVMALTAVKEPTEKRDTL